MRYVVIGTAGHIDHGKSALVQALTGTDPDRLKEEKARGITIDLGFAHYQDRDTNFAFVDVPGHERFVKNMLAGASGIDCVMLVVAADESVMPQTQEHFDICRLLRVDGGIIVLTKSDLVDRETLELVTLEVRELVAGSFLERAPIIAVSSKTGAGLPEVKSALADMSASVRGRRPTGVARLPIDRAFSVRGFGTVVTGTQVSGRIELDQELELLPTGRVLKVRGLQVHGRPQQVSFAGQRVAINLTGVEVVDLRRGDTLASVGGLEATRRFDATLDLLPDARPLAHGARVRFHQGTTEVIGRIALGGLARAPGQAADRGEGTSELHPGARAYVRVHLEKAAVLTRDDRYILRSYSPPTTIAGGMVLDPQPPRGRLRTAAGLERLQRLDPVAHAERGALEAVIAMIEERGAGGLSRRQLVSRAGIAPEALDATIARLVEDGRAVNLGDLIVDARVMERLAQQVMADVQRYHQSHPLEDGLPREEVRERLFKQASPAVFDRVLTGLATSGRLVARDHLAAAEHRVSLSPEEQAAQDAIAQAFRAAGFKPPELADIAAAAGISGAVVERVVRLLLRQKLLVRLDTLVFHQETLTHLKADVAALKVSDRAPVRIDVGTFKERYGISRKFAIPLLEYLDRERVTRRMGDARIVL